MTSADAVPRRRGRDRTYPDPSAMSFRPFYTPNGHVTKTPLLVAGPLSLICKSISNLWSPRGGDTAPSSPASRMPPCVFLPFKGMHGAEVWKQVWTSIQEHAVYQLYEETAVNPTQQPTLSITNILGAQAAEGRWTSLVTHFQNRFRITTAFVDLRDRAKTYTLDDFLGYGAKIYTLDDFLGGGVIWRAIPVIHFKGLYLSEDFTTVKFAVAIDSLMIQDIIRDSPRQRSPCIPSLPNAPTHPSLILCVLSAPKWLPFRIKSTRPLASVLPIALPCKP